MKKLFILASLFCICVSAHAQTYSFEFGGSFEPSSTPKTAGHLSLLASTDGKTFSYTTLLARGPQNRQFTYSFVSGVQRLIAIQGKLALFADAQGGVAASNTATSGTFLGGGALLYTLRPGLGVVLSGRAMVSPANGGVNPAVAIGFRVTP